MEDLEEMFLRMRSNDELDGDLTSLNAVKWDRVEFDKDGDRIGYDDVTGQSYSLGPMPPGVPPATVSNISRSVVGGAIGDAGKSFDNFVKSLGKYKVDIPFEAVLDTFGMKTPKALQNVKLTAEDAVRLFTGDIGRLVNEMSNGFYPVVGKGNTLRLKPEALDLLVPLEVIVPAAKPVSKAVKKMAEQQELNFAPPLQQ
tara:strand:+ start:1756 stop:2352 length:597 start_codon:yes stop_codon:yes gene_type:complete